MQHFNHHDLFDCTPLDNSNNRQVRQLDELSECQHSEAPQDQEVINYPVHIDSLQSIGNVEPEPQHDEVAVHQNHEDFDKDSLFMEPQIAMAEPSGDLASLDLNEDIQV